MRTSKDIIADIEKYSNELHEFFKNSINKTTNQMHKRWMESATQLSKPNYIHNNDTTQYKETHVNNSLYHLGKIADKLSN